MIFLAITAASTEEAIRAHMPMNSSPIHPSHASIVALLPQPGYTISPLVCICTRGGFIGEQPGCEG
jgi:hypothetical protein